MFWLVTSASRAPSHNNASPTVLYTVWTNRACPHSQQLTGDGDIHTGHFIEKIAKRSATQNSDWSVPNSRRIIFFCECYSYFLKATWILSIYFESTAKTHLSKAKSTWRYTNTVWTHSRVLCSHMKQPRIDKCLSVRQVPSHIRTGSIPRPSKFFWSPQWIHLAMVYSSPWSCPPPWKSRIYLAKWKDRRWRVMEKKAVGRWERLPMWGWRVKVRSDGGGVDTADWASHRLPILQNEYPLSEIIRDRPNNPVEHFTELTV